MELAKPGVWVGVGLSILATGVIPVIAAAQLADGYALISPADLFRLTMQFSPANLIFPLAAALPYSLALSTQIGQRYLVYTRTRVALFSAMRTRFVAAAAGGFLVGFAVPLLVFLWAFAVAPNASLVTFSPESALLTTPDQVHVADLHAFTFSQLLAFGDAAFGVGYSFFVGIVGALYSMITVACLFMMTNRFLAMATPWIANTALYFAMAVLGLEAWSTNIFFPANLTQLSLTNPMVVLAMLAAVTAVLLGVVFLRARTWDSWQ